MAAASQIQNDEVKKEKKQGAAFKYGLVHPFLGKFPFEDRAYMSSSEFYEWFGDDDFIPPEEPPNVHQLTKRFLKQVRESDGYDVDCIPHPSLFSPFGPQNIDKMTERYRNLVMGATHFAIDKINAMTGKGYVLVKHDKVVATSCSLILLTFSVKEVADSSAQLITLRATVNVPYGSRFETDTYELEEWMFKPPAAEDLWEYGMKGKEGMKPSSKKKKFDD